MHFTEDLDAYYNYRSSTTDEHPPMQKRRLSWSFLRHQQVRCLLSSRPTILPCHRHLKKVIWSVSIAFVLALLAVVYVLPYPYLLILKIRYLPGTIESGLL